MLIFAIVSFVISLSFTFFFVPYIRDWAYKKNILDVPGGIKQHKKETPYLGGVAVYLGFLVPLLILLPYKEHYLYFIFGLTILLVLGLVDDLLVITPLQKFLGQTVAALNFLTAGFCLKEVFLSSGANVTLSLLWILVVVNAFNLVDVMDSLATSLAIAAACSFLIFAYFFDLPEVAILLAAFLGALLGFLYYNRPPAQIYLGDAGSLFVGGFLAVVPFFFNWGFHSPQGFVVPVIILAIPLLEVSSLIVIRTYKGIPFYYGSPDHYCLYLRAKGWSIKEIQKFSFIVSLILFAFACPVAFDLLSLFEIVLLSLMGSLVWALFIFKNSFLSRSV